MHPSPSTALRELDPLRPWVRHQGVDKRMPSFRAMMIGVISVAAASACVPQRSSRLLLASSIPHFKKQAMTELETCAGLKWEPRAVTYRLIRCPTEDEDGTCSMWLGHSLVAGSTYVDDSGKATVYLCSCDKRLVHREVLRHELMHVLLLQHGITGHPARYRKCVARWTDWSESGSDRLTTRVRCPHSSFLAISTRRNRESAKRFVHVAKASATAPQRSGTANGTSAALRGDVSDMRFGRSAAFVGMLQSDPAGGGVRDLERRWVVAELLQSLFGRWRGVSSRGARIGYRVPGTGRSGRAVGMLERWAVGWTGRLDGPRSWPRDGRCMLKPGACV